MKKIIKISLLVLSLILLTLPTNSYSWERYGYHHGFYHGYHAYPHYGFYHGFYPYWFFPHGYVVITLGDVPYYYYGGDYYVYDNPAFVEVTPPVGAAVGSLPDEYQPIIINGQTYYTYNGTYYKKIKDEYQVVQPPVIVSTNKAVATTKDQGKIVNQNTQPESFTINIPNSKGGYTPVIIKRSGNGFVGPQGEYYKEFPSVAQLKVMYVK